MSEDAILERRIPDWLAPYKNEWRAMSGISSLFDIEGRPLSVWLQEIRPRLRCVTKTTTNGKGFARYYLVKQIWACSRAHGLKLIPSPCLTEDRDKTKALIRENQELRGRLYTEMQKPQVVRLVRPPDWTEMLTAMLGATEPRPMPGVYFLISEGVVVYVGQSQNVLARMHGHASKAFDTVKMIHVPDPTLRLIEEGRWINAFSPRDNIAGKIAA